MRKLSVAALEAAPISVAIWRAHLSPEAVAAYVFTCYDSLLSWMALELVHNQDFTTAGEFGRDTQTITNLRQALSELYEGSTCELRLNGSKGVLSITVPGGSLTTWPPQIAQPGPVSFPVVGGPASFETRQPGPVVPLATH